MDNGELVGWTGRRKKKMIYFPTHKHTHILYCSCLFSNYLRPGATVGLLDGWLVGCLVGLLFSEKDVHHQSIIMFG